MQGGSRRQMWITTDGYMAISIALIIIWWLAEVFGPQKHMQSIRAALFTVAVLLALIRWAIHI